MFRITRIIFFLLVTFINNSMYAEPALQPAITAPIPIDQLKNYSEYTPALKKLIHQAWYLSTKNLTYQYGSANPENKGMDCSGTMYYLLRNANIPDVPRDSDGMYQWVKKLNYLHPVTSHSFSSSEFSELKPGDLLFWSGTHHKQNSKSISHVMLYLGTNSDGKPLMFGSSDGRTYQGKKMWGVSVFDFLLPDDKTKAKFEGYSCIPNLTCS